jgi:hypothetical protein
VDLFEMTPKFRVSQIAPPVNNNHELKPVFSAP